MTTYNLKDVSKNWTPDEWINYGVIIAPSPRKIFPTDYVSDDNSKQIDPYYVGRGMAVVVDDGSGTYTVPNDSAYCAQYLPNSVILEAASIRPWDKNKQLGNLRAPALSAEADQCVFMYMTALPDAINFCYPTMDLYFDTGDLPFTDILGLKVYVQCAVRDGTAQSNGIKIDIFVFDTTNNDGRGTWEELTDKTGTERITTVDDETGTYGTFEHVFELNGGGTSYIDLAETSWLKYIYLRRKSSSSDEKRTIRLRIQGVDNIYNDFSAGMLVGHVYLQIIRSGADENYYKISDSGYQTLEITGTGLDDYYGETDLYIIAPSIQIIFSDMNSATYGYDGYDFIFNDQTGEDVFISSNFYGQSHIGTLNFCCEYGNYIWYCTDTDLILEKYDISNLTDSGVDFDGTVLNEDNTVLTYPYYHLLKYVTINGNKSLGLTYTATSSNSYVTKGATHTYQHLTGVSELKKLAESILARHEDLAPKVVVDLPYSTDLYPIKIGTYVTVTYKTVNENLRVKKRFFRYDAGKGLKVSYHLGEPESPPTIRIRDEINNINNRLKFIENRGAEQNFDNEAMIILQGYGGAGASDTEAGDYVPRDGSKPLTGNWNVAGYTIHMKTLRIDNDQDYYIEFIGTPSANRTVTFPNWDLTIGLTQNELDQLEKIGVTTISDTQWSWIGAMDQAVTTEVLQDTVGAMFTGNTETLITVTYQDEDGTIDLVVNESSIDHGSITGLGDDDHTQYTAHTQNETITGIWNFDTDTGSVPFYISRLGATTEALKVTIEDTVIKFDCIQDDDEGGDHYCIFDTDEAASPDSWEYVWKINADAHLTINHDAITLHKETTFSIFPITPSAAPDADYEVANKKYVDDQIVAGGGDYWSDPVDANIVPDVTETRSLGSADKYFSDLWVDDVHVSGEVNLGDNDPIYCGADDDLDIRHDGSNAKITNTTGSIYVLGAGGTLIFQGTIDSPLMFDATDDAWAYISFKHSGTRKAYFGIDSTPDLLVVAEAGDVRISGTTIVTTGGLFPSADNTDDLGKSGNEWKDLYVTGTSYLDAINTDYIVGSGYLVTHLEMGWLEDLYDTGVTSTEFDYLDGVTSNIQTQLDGKVKIDGTTVMTGKLEIGALDDEDYIYLNTTAVSNWSGIYSEGRLYLHCADYMHFKAGANKNMYFDAGDQFYWRDEDDSQAVLIQFNTGTRVWYHGTATDPVSFVFKSGSGNAIITDIFDQDTMSSDSATALATQQSIKAYVDDTAYQVGVLWLGGNQFICSAANAPRISDGFYMYGDTVTDSWYVATIPMDWRKIDPNSGYHYLKLTNIILYWYHGVASANVYLDRIVVQKYTANGGGGTATLDDGTNRYASSSGAKNYSWALNTNNTLDASYHLFRVLVYYATNTLDTDWRLGGALITYEYT